LLRAANKLLDFFVLVLPNYPRLTYIVLELDRFAHYLCTIIINMSEKKRAKPEKIADEDQKMSHKAIKKSDGNADTDQNSRACPDTSLVMSGLKVRDAPKNQDKMKNSCVAESYLHINEDDVTEEYAQHNYQKMLRDRNSEKVRLWRKKQRIALMSEGEQLAQATEENDSLLRQRQALTERLCDLNESIAEIQHKRAESLRQQVSYCF